MEITYLRRRVGARWFPIIGFNLIVPIGVDARLLANHKHIDFDFDFISKHPIGWNGVLFFIIYFIGTNIIPALYIYSVLAYRVGYDDEAIYARPYPNTGPYMRMAFDEIGRVDLFSFMRLEKAIDGEKANYRNALNQLSNIRLYRKNDDKKEIFLINSKELHGKQLKLLVRQIYDRCPNTFSDDMLRYLNSDKLCPPYAMAEKNGHPVYKW